MNTIIQGDCLAVLRTLPSESVQMCVTSPPYFGLRDYGVAGQIGLEASPEAYVAALIGVFREVRRVLRDDGTLWLNLGDAYAGSWGNYALRGITGTQRERHEGGERWTRRAYSDTTHKPATAQVAGLKPKDQLFIPHRVAMALQADGWWVRSTIIWHKPNCMPESVRDRPTQAHEYLFLLTKSEHYYFDAQAVREPAQTPAGSAGKWNGNRDFHLPGGQTWFARPNLGGSIDGFRNSRTVWSVNTAPYKGAHFAVMPPKLVEPCILAGSSQQACEQCGAPWARVMQRTKHPARDVEAQRQHAAASPGRSDGHVPGPSGKVDHVRIIGWQPTCTCIGSTGSGRCVVLDPFAGAGTVPLVAAQHGRAYLGIELNAQYIALAERRITEALSAPVKPRKSKATAPSLRLVKPAAVRQPSLFDVAS